MTEEMKSISDKPALPEPTVWVQGHGAAWNATAVDTYADQCTAAAQARVAELEGALRSLVELKDFKATIAQGSLHEAEHKKAQYRTRQPRVWAAARAALASTSGAEPKEQS